ncbi:MAG TPA: hypothetical protein VFK44_14590 [Bacillales bacterium]|nr:hypothetical protein [Bacillales bacterium]
MENETTARYFALADKLKAADAAVQCDYHPKRKRFGSAGELKIENKIFAFLLRGRLVVKLPKERVDDLQQAGVGEPCTMGNRVMKQWFAIHAAEVDWFVLAEEAKAFVLSKL